MGLATAIARVQTLVGALSGMKGAPSKMPDKLHSFPFSVAYPGAGTWAMAYMGGAAIQDTGQIVIDLHLCSQDKGVAAAMDALGDYFETLPKALAADETLDGNITDQGMGPQIIVHDGLLALTYAGIDTYACRWRLNYEREETL